MSVRLNSNMFPKVYEDLGINTNKLGCIMLDVKPFDVVSLVPGGEDDIYWHPDREEHPYTGGAPAEHSAHCTLLYGLLEPGPEWSDQVDTVLEGWIPEDDYLCIEEVSYFPSNIPGEDYSVIIGKLELRQHLVEGHQRLQLLPHIDTFPEYHPHITLAYVKAEATQKWIDALTDEFDGARFPVQGLNYGGD